MVQVTIAAGSKIAAEAGATIANQGGNAVDAALATTLVSMCTDIAIMAPGGSGFITIWPPGEEPIVIDAYAEMPGRGLPSDSLIPGGREVTFNYGGWMNTRIGYGSVATPGMFAGLGMAHEQFGSIAWDNIVAPALHWAQKGFPLFGASAEYLSLSKDVVFSWHPDSYKAIHHRDGSCIQLGEIIQIPELVDSLELIAQEGVSAFYTGEIGQKIASEMAANGGVLTADDLAAYQPIRRDPIRFRFRDWEIVTNPAPAIGGACLSAMLLLLEHQPLQQWSSAEVRRLVEVQQAVLDYRNHHFVEVQENLLSREVTRLLELASMGNPSSLISSPSTIHISAVDSDGLACSITASAGYGSGVMSSGLWLNNSLGELELHPQGLQGFAVGDRLVSNMAPTIARHRDGAVLAIGSPGASRITTAIAQVLLNFCHLGMPLSEAIAHPRLHCEFSPNSPVVAFEGDIPVDSLSNVTTRHFPELFMYFGGVQAALWHPDKGLSSAADPRREGGVAYGGF